MEPVSLVKLGAPGVTHTTTAEWASWGEETSFEPPWGGYARPTIILNKIPKHVANIQGICKYPLIIGLLFG